MFLGRCYFRFLLGAGVATSVGIDGAIVVVFFAVLFTAVGVEGIATIAIATRQNTTKYILTLVIEVL